MNSVFLDTSGLIGVVNADDQWHSQAETVWLELVSSSVALFTTSLILIELADGLSRLRHREMAIQTIEALRNSDLLTVVQSDAHREAQAWELYCERVDKEWGMTDCVSMMVMKEQNIQHVFTADSHFEQAGFHVLLKQN